MHDVLNLYSLHVVLMELCAGFNGTEFDVMVLYVMSVAGVDVVRVNPVLFGDVIRGMFFNIS